MGGKLEKERHQAELWKHLGIVLKPHVATAFNFREFSGIAAFTERIFQGDFSNCALGQKKQGTYTKPRSVMYCVDEVMTCLYLINYFGLL